MDVEALLRPVVEGAGLELVDLTFGREGGRRILRVTVDRDGGVDLDSIADVSEKISRRLDLEDVAEDRYRLEVTSPGIERPLRTPAQFARAIGERVRVKTAVLIEGARIHVGTLTGVDTDSIELDLGGERRRVPLAEIASARTVVDWAAELRGGP
jgi:ribosome maturation factor RimP